MMMIMISDQILDVNDNAPVCLHPMSTSGDNNASTDDADLVLWNRATSGHVITTVSASDADDGSNSDIEYTLIDGNDDHLFHIDRKLGDITLRRSLHGSTDDQVNLQSALEHVFCILSQQRTRSAY